MLRIPTPPRTLPLLIVLLILVAACSDDSSPTDPTPDPRPTGNVLYVDQATGSDDNPGSESQPFATITAALDAAEMDPEFDTVRVGPGIYGDDETFPLQVRAGVSLVGDEDTRGDDAGTPTEIRGFGPFELYHGASRLIYQSATVLGADGSEVRGFRITAPGSVVNVGVAYVGRGPGQGAMTVSRNTIAQHHTGVLVDSVGEVQVADNVIGDVVDGGTFYSAVGPVFRDNLVRVAGTGVDVAVGMDGSLVVEGNHFELTSASAIGVYAQSATPLISQNTILAANGVSPTAGILAGSGSPVLRANHVEVSPAVLAWNAANVDMGDESTPGENDFSAVEGLALDVRGSAHVRARGNFWPHDPPRYGEDLIVRENGTFDVDYVYELFVDVGLGDDGNDGMQAHPLRTITAALEASPPATRIRLAPGTYGPLETFPLMMHPGLVLEGDEADRGASTIIEGEGAHTTYSFEWATIIGAPNAEIAGVTLRSATEPFAYFGLMVDEGPMTIRHNTFEKGYGAFTAAGALEFQFVENTVRTESYGLYANGTEDTRVEGNDIVTHIPANLRAGLVADNEITINTYTGATQASAAVRIENNVFTYQREYDLDMRYGALLVSYGSPRIRNNTFHADRGILIRNGTPDVGTGDDLGGNDFADTKICGIEYEGSETVYAVGNAWTNDPPVIGEDILLTGEGTVVTSAAAR